MDFRKATSHIFLASPDGATCRRYHWRRPGGKALGVQRGNPARSAAEPNCSGWGPVSADLEHDPENACPGLDPAWVPVFGKDHAQIWVRARPAPQSIAASALVRRP